MRLTGPASKVPWPLRHAFKVAVALASVTATLLALDLLFLGVVARGFYAAALGPLMRPEVNRVAAGLFYAFYVVAIVLHAVRGAPSVASAARRGAGLGLVAYGTYELTNWAVIAGWPAVLVPVDLLWGVVLTAGAAAMGRFVSGFVALVPETKP